MEDILKEFLSETVESLGVLDLELVRFEQHPDDPELLGSIFRIVHTIKGTCGFLGLPRLEKLAHAGENVLGRIRDGKLSVTQEAISLVLAALDGIKAIVAALAESEQEPPGEDAALIQRLNALAGLVAPKAEAEEIPIAEPFEAPVDEAAPMKPRASRRRKAKAPAEALAAEVHADEPVAETVPAPASVVAAPIAAPVAQAAPDAPARDLDGIAQTIRVNVDLLEDLMTIVSELVLTRNQLMQTLRTQKDSPFTTPLQRLSQVTTELQEGVMKTRMQPIGNAWSKMPRLVRDLARDLGKKLDLRMIGAETELDRQVLEMVKDPLTHMVRNCADHGIETPADRVSSGKPEMGTITLNAFHVGGHIVVEIGDDGRGIAVERIRHKAVANGLASEAEVEAMSDQQLYQFIFRAGFSTAAKVTNVSGRGVGLDVVKTNIEKIGGTVELRSEPGKGSTFVIKIPLTLAIVAALIVECGGERFAVPQINVSELVRAGTERVHRIETINNAPVLRLRERLLPLVSLKSLMGMGEPTEQQDSVFVVVTQVGAQNFGIIVDRVFDTEEIVVKPVSPRLRDIPMYSGNTILGDGSVIMILDPSGIAATAGITAEKKEEKQIAASAAAGSAYQTVLLFRAGGEEPKAVPLELVARLEVLDKNAIEHSAGNLVTQYRGKLMPLVAMSGDNTVRDHQPVLVFCENDRNAGVIVDEILDIVDATYSIDLKSAQPGIVGSAVIAGKATDLIDISYYLGQAAGDWFSTETEVSYGSAPHSRRVLLVDDSPFFRNMLKPLLNSAGYIVTAVESAEAALELIERGESYDVVISDIEMPKLDGYQFAEALRGSERWSGGPMIALTSHFTAQDQERSRQSGFVRHIAKSNPTELLRAISDTVEQEKAAA